MQLHVGEILRQEKENLFEFYVQVCNWDAGEEISKAWILPITDEHFTMSGFETNSCHGPQNPLPMEILPEHTNNPNSSLY